jgi:hypothetical protein
MMRDHLTRAELCSPRGIVLQTPGFATSNGGSGRDELIALYAVDHARNYCLGLCRFPDDPWIEVMVIDQVIHRTTELTVELSRARFRLTLSADAASHLDGVTEYVVPLIPDDEELDELDRVLTILFEGGARGRYERQF